MGRLCDYLTMWSGLRVVRPGGAVGAGAADETVGPAGGPIDLSLLRLLEPPDPDGLTDRILRHLQELGLLPIGEPALSSGGGESRPITGPCE